MVKKSQFINKTYVLFTTALPELGTAADLPRQSSERRRGEQKEPLYK
jgi:hypothetical protein